MKTSVIRYRVADFLRDHPPFDLFTLEELLTFSGTGRVIFHEDDIYLFRKGEPREPLLWVIQQGKVEIIDENPTGERLRDVLGPGDILGLTRQTEPVAYSDTARTATEVILYSFEKAAFEALVGRYPEAARFLTAHLSATSRYTKALQAPPNRERLLAEQEKTVWLNAPAPPPTRPASRLTACSPAEAHHLKQCGFQTAPPGLNAGEYFLAMLRSRQSLITLTADGSLDSPPLGLVSDSDLSIGCGRNPIPIQQEMLRAKTVAELAYLRGRFTALYLETLAGPSVIERLSQMLGEFNSVLVEKLIEISKAEMAGAGRSDTGTAACWLFIGGAGRQELLAEDAPRLGIVYAEPSINEAIEVNKYFRTLKQKVEAKLQACGLTTSSDRPAAAAADCRTLAEWKTLYAGLIDDPITNSIYTSRDYFDLQIAAGERDLGLELQEAIQTKLARQELFIPVLANDTFANLPPLTFFQGAMIDSDGSTNQDFDFEKHALAPIVDSARVTALAERHIFSSNTIERLSTAARSSPQYASILNDAIEAWRIVAYQQASARNAQRGDGADRQPLRLSRFDQRLLKSAFDSIRRLLELTDSLYNSPVRHEQ